MTPFLHHYYGNPSSLHRLGRLARSAIDMAREQVAALVRVQPSQVVFTSGATEANNLAIKGILAESPPGVIAIGATEHPSVVAPAEAMQRVGFSLRRLPVDAAGRMQTAALDALAEARDTRLVSLMCANNETGVIHDLSTHGPLLRAAGVLVHCDAVQAAGKLPLDFCASGAHLMTLSAHKMYGPKGAGALIVDRGLALTPLLDGGGQEQGLRGGTENVAAIVGFGKAAELALTELEQRRAHCLALRTRLERALDAMPGAIRFGKDAPRLCNTVQFALPGVDGEMLVMLCDRHRIAVSSGSACASAGAAPSPVLAAMGVPPELARCAVRVSVGACNTEAQMDALCAILQETMDPCLRAVQEG